MALNLAHKKEILYDGDISQKGFQLVTELEIINQKNTEIWASLYNGFI